MWEARNEKKAAQYSNEQLPHSTYSEVRRILLPQEFWQFIHFLWKVRVLWDPLTVVFLCHSPLYNSKNEEIMSQKKTWVKTLANLCGLISFIFFPPGVTQPIVGVYFTALYRALASSRTRLLDHTQRRVTVGRIPLSEWSVRRRDLYLTTHNTHNRQTSMPRVRFEPTIAAGERP